MVLEWGTGVPNGLGKGYGVPEGPEKGIAPGVWLIDMGATVLVYYGEKC